MLASPHTSMNAEVNVTMAMIKGTVLEGLSDESRAYFADDRNSFDRWMDEENVGMRERSTLWSLLKEWQLEKRRERFKGSALDGLNDEQLLYLVNFTDKFEELMDSKMVDVLERSRLWSLLSECKSEKWKEMLEGTVLHGLSDGQLAYLAGEENKLVQLMREKSVPIETCADVLMLLKDWDSDRRKRHKVGAGWTSNTEEPGKKRKSGLSDRNVEEQKTIARGQAFVDAILSNMEDIVPDVEDLKAEGMRVLKNVPMLEVNATLDVVVRSITEPFWMACLDLVNTPEMRYRVCAVGTAGIGKTTVTPVLIRMLLMQGRTVVYRINGQPWCYEFVPARQGKPETPESAAASSSKGKPTVSVRAYFEEDGVFKINSLRESSTYYVVDPGNTFDSCNPTLCFEANVIIVSSPDSRHWGEYQFSKPKGTVCGLFKLYPLWTLEELVTARHCFRRKITVEEIIDRYRQVGGIPSHVFYGIEVCLRQQRIALSNLSETRAFYIASHDLNMFSLMNSSLPYRHIMGFVVPNKDGVSQIHSYYFASEIVLASSSLKETVYRTYMKTIWKIMQEQGLDGWPIFEAYCRSIMAAGEPIELECYDFGLNLEAKSRIRFGGCEGIRLVLNMVEAFQGQPNILYHFVKRWGSFVDFIYQDDSEQFHVFHVAIDMPISADIGKIEELANLFEENILSVYYLVPEYALANWMESSADTLMEEGGCNIKVVAIPKPKE